MNLLTKKLLSKHKKYNIRGHPTITFAIRGKGEGVGGSIRMGKHANRGRGGEVMSVQKFTHNFFNLVNSV